MSKRFKLTAIPSLLFEGEFQGSLETITFVAESETEAHKWWSVNTGALVSEFEQVVSPELAGHLVSRLKCGETVEFPNRYELSEVKGKFGGRWSS